MNMLAIFWGTLRDILPIVAIIFGFQYLVTRKPVKRFLKVAIGFFMVWVGLSFFLIGLLVFPIYGYYGHISDGFEKNKIANLKDDRKKYYVSFVEEKKKIESREATGNNASMAHSTACGHT